MGRGYVPKVVHDKRNGNMENDVLINLLCDERVDGDIRHFMFKISIENNSEELVRFFPSNYGFKDAFIVEIDDKIQFTQVSRGDAREIFNMCFLHKGESVLLEYSAEYVNGNKYIRFKHFYVDLPDDTKSITVQFKIRSVVSNKIVLTF
jgi:hypothetical protein